MDRMNDTLRINCFDAARHHFDFRLSQFTIEGVKLSIDVADADIIEVNERQFTYARACQRLNCPRTDAPKPDNGYMRAAQSRRGVCIE